MLSNGVGMLRSMLDEWNGLLGSSGAGEAHAPAPPSKTLTKTRLERAPNAPPELLAKTPPKTPPKKVVWITGRLAAPALEAMADRWQSVAGWRPEVLVVDNDFFGSQVSVSGLLAGVDLIHALRSLPPEVDVIVLPRGAFGFDGRRTLDGVTAEEIGATHPGAVHLASTPRELAHILGPTALRRTRRRV